MPEGQLHCVECSSRQEGHGCDCNGEYCLCDGPGLCAPMTEVDLRAG